jgi:hypothetical protein
LGVDELDNDYQLGCYLLDFKRTSKRREKKNKEI